MLDIIVSSYCSCEQQTVNFTQSLTSHPKTSPRLYVYLCPIGWLVRCMLISTTVCAFTSVTFCLCTYSVLIVSIRCASRNIDGNHLLHCYLPGWSWLKKIDRFDTGPIWKLSHDATYIYRPHACRWHISGSYFWIKDAYNNGRWICPGLSGDASRWQKKRRRSKVRLLQQELLGNGVNHQQEDLFLRNLPRLLRLQGWKRIDDSVVKKFN